MLKIFGSTIYRPLEIICKDALSTGLFPSEWEKGNTVPINTTGDKQVLKSTAPFHCFQFQEKILKD